MRGRVAAFAAGVAGLLALAIAVPPSAASWRDEEWIASPVGAVECGDPGAVDATAWSRILTGTLLGQPLEPVAAIDGLTVTNTGTTSTATSSAAVTDLGSDAWTSSLALSALSALSIGAGVTLPFGTNTGAYTQYARATSAGLSVGAAGAVTSAGSGVAALESPSSATPRVADLRLSTLLDSALPGLGVTTGQLTDVGLRIGTVGALASYDSCDTLWSDIDPGAALERQYLVNDLGLDLTSNTISGFTTALRGSLASLETTLDALLAPGTSVTGTALTSITSALDSALNLNVLGVGISLAQVRSVRVGVDFALQPVIDLVTGTLSDGVVTTDLTSGKVSADLEALFDAAYGHSGGLNGLAPNTSVLTAPVLSELSRRVGVLLQGFVTGTIQPALTAALNAASVTAVIDASLRTRLGIINLVGLNLLATITGTAAGFTTGSPAPTVSVVASEASSGILNGLLALLGLPLSSLVNAVQGAVVAPLVGTVVPVIGSAVVAPVLATATGLAAGLVSTLTGTTIPAVLTALAPVLTALGTLVRVVVNARPDAPGSVGPPAAAAPGRWFQSALHVGVVNAASASVAALYLANASVGPNALR